MLVKVLIDTSGKESVFLSNGHRYVNGLKGLSLFRNQPEALEQLQVGIDHFGQKFEAAMNGDRAEIAMRNKARKEVTEMLKKAVSYLQSVANEDDIPELLQAGFEVRRIGIRRRTATAPAAG